MVHTELRYNQGREQGSKMTRDELLNLIAQGEGQRLEFNHSPAEVEPLKPPRGAEGAER